LKELRKGTFNYGKDVPNLLLFKKVTEVDGNLNFKFKTLIETMPGHRINPSIFESGFD